MQFLTKCDGIQRSWEAVRSGKAGLSRPPGAVLSSRTRSFELCFYTTLLNRLQSSWDGLSKRGLERFEARFPGSRWGYRFLALRLFLDFGPHGHRISCSVSLFLARHDRCSWLCRSSAGKFLHGRLVLIGGMRGVDSCAGARGGDAERGPRTSKLNLPTRLLITDPR